MLLDSASLYFRAFYGVPDRRATPDAMPNNAIRGFLDMIATLVSDHAPTQLVACWDNDWRPAFRVEAIPSYKTHRMVEGTDGVEESPEDLTPQVPVIVDVLAAVGITRLGVDGYEADDVIGTLAVGAHVGARPTSTVRSPCPDRCSSASRPGTAAARSAGRVLPCPNCRALTR